MNWPQTSGQCEPIDIMKNQQLISDGCVQHHNLDMHCSGRWSTHHLCVLRQSAEVKQTWHVVSPVSSHPSATLSSLLLDLSGAVLPSFFHLVHKCVFDPPEAAAHLSQVIGHLAGLLPDLPQRLGPHDPRRGVPAGYLSLSDGVGRDLGRPADRTRVRQLLDHMEVVEEVV